MANREEQPANQASEPSTPSFLISQWMILRGVAFVYLIAFLSLLPQYKGLIGSEGILPVFQFLTALSAQVGAERFFLVPSLGWISSSDPFMLILVLLGAVCSICAMLGILSAPCFIVTWAVYLSILSVGQDFLSFQWDILLLEAGFLSIFMAPWNVVSPWSPLLSPLKNRGPAYPEGRSPAVLLWLFRLLLFRLMFMSGIVKLMSGDSTWHDLTALCYHYETQPLPTPLGWVAHQMPLWFQKVSCAIMFAIEIGVPFLIFGPRLARVSAAVLLFSLQVLIALTGNYTFFNLLTIVLCFSLLDDDLLKKVVSPELRSKICTVFDTTTVVRKCAAAILTSLVILLSVSLFLRTTGAPGLLPYPIRLAVSFLSSFHLVNSYGLFAVMTTTRNEIIIEGSMDGKNWLAYEFPFKPGDPRRPPPIVAPYQPRLDWQMWFAALGNYSDNPWTIRLLQGLLVGSKDVLGLLSHNPFPEKPPRYVRASLYRYHFSDWGRLSKTGEWWTREPEGEYTPTITLSENATGRDDRTEHHDNP